MGKKRSENDIEEIVLDMGYKLLEIYFNGMQRVVILDKRGYKYDTELHNLMAGYKPRVVRTTNPFSLENISLWIKLNNRNFKLVESGEYFGNRKSLKLYCNKCKEIFNSNWFQISHGYGCAICEGIQIGERNSFEYLQPELAKEWSSKNKILPSELSANSSKKILWECSKCKYEWCTSVNKRNIGSGCPACSGRVLTDRNRLSIIHPKISSEWHSSKNGNLKPYDILSGTEKKAWWICSECGYEWESSVKSRTMSKRGCPSCADKQKESKSATKIREYLKNFYNIIEEYRILKNPKTGRYLSFDIYLPDKNVFIEIHGEQHYKLGGIHRMNSKRKGTSPEEEFKYQKYRDKIKKVFAKQNGIYIEIDAREELDFENIINLIENR